LDNNAENPTPEKSEKQKNLEDIVSLSGIILSSWKSTKIVGILIVIAALAYIFVLMAGFSSDFMFPVLAFVMIGNQVYTARIRKKEKKLDEMKKAYESKFGVVGSSN
jgi:hypothetical protein